MKDPFRVHPTAIVALVMLMGGCSGRDGTPSDFIEKGRHHLASYPLRKSSSRESESTPLAEDAFRRDAFTLAFKTSYHPGNEMWVVYLDSDGACAYYFACKTPTGELPMQVHFSLSSDEVRDVRNLLDSLRIDQLADIFDANLADGTRIEFRLQTGARSKRIACYNHFPDAVVALHDFIVDKIVVPHTVELSRAKQVDSEEYNRRFFLHNNS